MAIFTAYLFLCSQSLTNYKYYRKKSTFRSDIAVAIKVLAIFPFSLILLSAERRKAVSESVHHINVRPSVCLFLYT